MDRSDDVPSEPPLYPLSKGCIPPGLARLASWRSTSLLGGALQAASDAIDCSQGMRRRAWLQHLQPLQSGVESSWAVVQSCTLVGGRLGLR
jgi:hypothetical protein